MKKHENINQLYFSLISKYRAVLMGTAILMIMFCHLDVARSHNGFEISRLANLLHINTVGVDIFMFLSGFGLYYSYSKHQPPYFVFEKKRLLRVLPLYLLIGGITYFLYDMVIQHLTVGKFLRDLFFVSWFTEGSTKYWYILAITVFYLLFPLLYRMIHGGMHGAAKTAVFCVLWWFVTELLFWKWYDLETFRMPLARLPIFTVGIYCGRLSRENIRIQRSAVALLIILGFAVFLVFTKKVPQPYSKWLYYPVRGLFGISIIGAVILVMEIVSRTASRFYTVLFSALSWFGGLTLELYLLHQSWLILLDYPYRFTSYVGAAFLLPTAVAALFSWRRSNGSSSGRSGHDLVQMKSAE